MSGCLRNALVNIFYRKKIVDPIHFYQTDHAGTVGDARVSGVRQTLHNYIVELAAAVAAAIAGATMLCWFLDELYMAP